MWIESFAFGCIYALGLGMIAFGVWFLRDPQAARKIARFLREN